MDRVIKYFVQFQTPCKKCKRPSVDVVSSSEKEGLMLSRHFPPGKLSFCEWSFVEYVRCLSG